MTPSPNNSRFKPIDPVRMARQHYKLLIIASVIGLVAGLALYFGLRHTAALYTSDAKLVVDTRTIENVWTPETSTGALGGGSLDAAQAYMNNECNFIVSDEIVRSALDRPRSKDTDWFRSMPSVEAAKEAMQEEMLTATVVRKTTLIRVSMTGPSPNDARRCCSKRSWRPTSTARNSSPTRRAVTSAACSSTKAPARATTSAASRSRWTASSKNTTSPA